MNLEKKPWKWDQKDNQQIHDRRFENRTQATLARPKHSHHRDVILTKKKKKEKKKKETNKLPSIEELYKWTGFWQKIEIKSRVYEYFLCQAFHTIPNKTEAHMQTDWGNAFLSDVLRSFISVSLTKGVSSPTGCFCLLIPNSLFYSILW